MTTITIAMIQPTYIVYWPSVCIIEYNTKNHRIQPVIVDTKKDTLKFRPNKKITGINIIENMLMWTDNFNEPRKINIQRCK